MVPVRLGEHDLAIERYERALALLLSELDWNRFPELHLSILEPARPETFNFRFAADRKFLRVENTMALTAGEKLGSYEIFSPLGAGGMGEVYRARDTKLGRDVAIKLLPDFPLIPYLTMTRTPGVGGSRFPLSSTARTE